MAERKLKPHGLWSACYGLTEFEFDEETALANYTAWVCDASHCIPIYTPLFMCVWVDSINVAMPYAAEMLSCPQGKGIIWRIKDGYVYVSVPEAKEEEVKQREEAFRQNIAPYVEDFWVLWQKEAAEREQAVKPFKEFDLERASNAELQKFFEDYLEFWRENWYSHFKFMYASYYIYALFQSLCHELTGIAPEDVKFKTLVSGFDNRLFRINRQLWRLGDRAKELGLGELFTTIEDDAEVLRRLEESEAGRGWLEEYRAFLRENGWVCQRWQDWASPTWIEKPSLGIPYIRGGIAKGGIFTLDEQRKHLAKEHEEIEKELLSKVPIEQREWFGKLMKVAQTCSSWTEEHECYMGMPACAVGRHLTTELGRRFAQAGVIDDPEDIYFLLPGEIRRAIIPLGRENLRPYVEARRMEFEEYRKIDPAPLIGTMEGLATIAAKDPLIGIAAGVPMVKPELKADLYGAASAPGVVEGIARIVFTEAELRDVQPGEIIVVPITSISWTPIFSIIAGVVADAGAAMSHPAIVSREYGIPAVVGTMEATKKIKTGHRIRVDGDNCCVYILEEA